MIGTIVKIFSSAGYGFVKRLGHSPGDREIFFHCLDLADDLPFSEALIEQRVEFVLTRTAKDDEAREVRAAN